MPDSAPFRVGHGYDLHRLEPLRPRGQGKPFVLAGVRLEHPLGPVGHSDGDTLLHAVTDALLGALGQPDIGQLFPDTDLKWAGAASRVFVEEAVRRVAGAGYALGNIDCTIICQSPKIAPVKDRLRGALAEMLGAPVDRVNVKGKTHELLADRADKAVEVHVVVMLERRGEGEGRGGAR
jgi:2-C-methyl-D-erythritol 2,4-cyclodiphosphate synthase